MRYLFANMRFLQNIFHINWTIGLSASKAARPRTGLGRYVQEPPRRLSVDGNDSSIGISNRVAILPRALSYRT